MFVGAVISLKPTVQSAFSDSRTDDMGTQYCGDGSHAASLRWASEAGSGCAGR